MFEIATPLSSKFSAGFLHQLAYDESNSLIVYARIAGRPQDVRSIAGVLKEGGHVYIKMGKGMAKFIGYNGHKALFHKLDNFGVATVYSSGLFSPEAGESFIVGHDNEYIKDAFKLVLKRKNIVAHENWDVFGIMRGLGLVDDLKTFNIKGVKVSWNEDQVNDHLGKQVRDGTLKF